MKTKLNTIAANDKRIREAFDLLFYVCRKELTPDEFEFVKGLRKHFFERGSLSEKQEQCLFTMAEVFKQKPLK